MRPIKEKHEEEEAKTMKRSTSNPLLYFNERRGNIMEVKE